MSQLLLVITWYLDSPYGTYVAGDQVGVYIDTETYAISVKKGATPITTGADIPTQSWNYNGLPDTEYKDEYTYQSSICQSIDLITFERVGQFPYLRKVVLQNHPSCVTADPDNPVVCDLSFTSLPIITKASSATATDGAITVSATSSSDPVKYKLNSDFEYNDGTGQLSGTFSGLGKGNYIVYARDTLNCIAVQSITITIDNSYGVLYVLEYYDNRVFAHHKTEVLQKNYAGPPIEIKAGPKPTIYSLRGEGETDKFISILTGEIVFNLMSESDGYFRELYTNDPEKFRLTHSIDTGSGYEAVWTGKISPNQFQEAYKSPPYDIDAVAIDGLTSLKEIYLLDDIGNRLYGSFKQITLIAWILNKIGLDLNIRSACNIYATTMDSTDSDDPLDQAYVDVERYYLLLPNPTCWDVLSYILDAYGAHIIQYYNVWNILRVEERYSVFDYREYDSNGNYLSNGSYDPIKDLKNSAQSNRMVWKDQSQLLKINPGYGNLRLLYNLGLKSNILLNGDFAIKKFSYYTNVGGNLDLIKGSNVDLTGFQLVNNNCVISTGVEYLEEGVALELTCNNHPGSTYPGTYYPVGYLTSDIQTLKMGNTDSIKIIYRVKITPLGSLTKPYWVKARVKIRYGSYFLKKSGEWTTTDTDIKFYIDRSQLNSFQNFEVLSDGFPDITYLDGESFFAICYCSNYYDTEFTSLSSFKAKATVDLEVGEREEFADTNTYKYYELKETTDADDDELIVRPNDYNATTNAVQWVKQGDAATIRLTSPQNGGCKLSIDKIQIEYLSNFKSLPEFSTYEQPMENDNNLNLDREIFHGSLIYNGNTTIVHKESQYSPRGNVGPTYIISYDNIFFKANSANITYAGYLRDVDGVGFTTWSRDSIVGEKELEKIYIDMVTAQYNRAWFSIHGPMTGDLLFSPIDTLNETMDTDRKYFPIFLSIDYRSNFYDAQFLELMDVASATEGAAEFNNDFNLDFTS